MTTAESKATSFMTQQSHSAYPKLTIKYQFFGPESVIQEVERHDVASDAKMADRWFWMRIHHKSGRVERLAFRSMSLGARDFDQGLLTFGDTTTGTATWTEHLPGKSDAAVSETLQTAGVVSKCVMDWFVDADRELGA
jgi:hypothetical protein